MVLCKPCKSLKMNNEMRCSVRKRYNENYYTSRSSVRSRRSNVPQNLKRIMSNSIARIVCVLNYLSHRVICRQRSSNWTSPRHEHVSELLSHSIPTVWRWTMSDEQTAERVCLVAALLTLTETETLTKLKITNLDPMQKVRSMNQIMFLVLVTIIIIIIIIIRAIIILLVSIPRFSSLEQTVVVLTVWVVRPLCRLVTLSIITIIITWTHKKTTRIMLWIM